MARRPQWSLHEEETLKHSLGSWQGRTWDRLVELLEAADRETGLSPNRISLVYHRLQEIEYNG